MLDINLSIKPCFKGTISILLLITAVVIFKGTKHDLMYLYNNFILKIFILPDLMVVCANVLQMFRFLIIIHRHQEDV